MVLFAVAGCDNNDAAMEEEESGSIYLRIEGLEPLSDGYHLEGWVTDEALTDDNLPLVRSVGKFNTNENGLLVNMAGEEILAGELKMDFSVAGSYVMFITIEPPNDADATPSNTRLMGGLFIDGTAQLRTTDVEGIEDGLVLSIGNFIVETPTDGPGTNEKSGIWFVNLTGGAPARGLRITIPIEGWSYHGWASFDGIRLDMGRIAHHSSADDLAQYSGTVPGYDYPGEDFLVNAPEGLTFPDDSLGRARVCDARARTGSLSGTVSVRAV